MRKLLKRIAVALENIYMQLRVLNEGRDAFCREVLNVLTQAKSGEPGPHAPERDTELDDEIEQILGQFIASPTDRVRARNEICAAIQARGYDVYARPAPRA